MFNNINDNKLVCPHCQTKGNVTTQMTIRKGSTSATKIVSGILTGGLSFLVTGISKKHMITEAYCLNCDTKWIISA